MRYKSIYCFKKESIKKYWIIFFRCSIIIVWCKLYFIEIYKHFHLNSFQYSLYKWSFSITNQDDDNKNSQPIEKSLSWALLLHNILLYVFPQKCTEACIIYLFHLICRQEQVIPCIRKITAVFAIIYINYCPLHLDKLSQCIENLLSALHAI